MKVAKDVLERRIAPACNKNMKIARRLAEDARQRLNAGFDSDLSTDEGEAGQTDVDSDGDWEYDAEYYDTPLMRDELPASKRTPKPSMQLPGEGPGAALHLRGPPQPPLDPK